MKRDNKAWVEVKIVNSNTQKTEKYVMRLCKNFDDTWGISAVNKAQNNEIMTGGQ